MASPLPSDKLVTIVNDKLQARERLEAALQHAWPDPLDRKTVANRTGLSAGTVGNLFSVGHRDGWLKKIRRGRYTIPGPRGVSPLGFENIVLVARRSDKARPERARSAQTRLDAQERRTAMPGFAGADKIERRMFFGDWQVYVQEFSNGTTEMQVGAKGSPPMTIPRLLEFKGWQMGAFPEIPDEGPEGWHVRMYELSHDYRNLRIDGLPHGARSISFRLFVDVWVKFYQKEGVGLRVEFRARRDVPLRELMACIEESFARVDKLDLEAVRHVDPLSHGENGPS